MTAEEVLRIIRDLPDEERYKVLLGVMKDLNLEMDSNPEFRRHAADAMHRFMEKRRKKGEDVSDFEAIVK